MTRFFLDQLRYSVETCVKNKNKKRDYILAYNKSKKYSLGYLFNL